MDDLPGASQFSHLMFLEGFFFLCCHSRAFVPGRKQSKEQTDIKVPLDGPSWASDCPEASGKVGWSRCPVEHIAALGAEAVVAASPWPPDHLTSAAASARGRLGSTGLASPWRC